MLCRGTDSVIMVSETFLISHDLHWLASHAQAIKKAMAFYVLYDHEAGLVWPSADPLPVRTRQRLCYASLHNKGQFS